MRFSRSSKNPATSRNLTSLSDEEKALLLRLHTQEGRSPYEICKLHPEIGSLRSVLRILREAGVYRENSCSKTTLESRKNECIDLYRSLGSFRKVAEAMGDGVTKDQVDFCLQKYAPEIVKRKPTLSRPDFFEKIDCPEKAYLLGFIAADGYLNPPNSPNRFLEVFVNVKDVWVIERFKEYLGASHRLTYKPSVNAVGIHIGNNKLVLDIEKYGIFNNKSLSLGNVLSSIPNAFKGSFICGFWDGDGSIGAYAKKGCSKKALLIRAVGTRECLQGISDYLGIPGTFYRDKRHSEKTWIYSFSKKADCEKFFSMVYKDCPLKLDRKCSKFFEVDYIMEKYGK